METLRVSANSNPNAVAGAIANVLRRGQEAVITVVGAAALNQAMKAVAIARGHVQGEGVDPVCIPSFVEVQIDGDTRTGVQLRIEDRDAVVDLRDTAVVITRHEGARRIPPPPGWAVASRA